MPFTSFELVDALEAAALLARLDTPWPSPRRCPAAAAAPRPWRCSGSRRRSSSALRRRGAESAAAPPRARAARGERARTRAEPAAVSPDVRASNRRLRGTVGVAADSRPSDRVRPRSAAAASSASLARSSGNGAIAATRAVDVLLGAPHGVRDAAIALDRVERGREVERRGIGLRAVRGELRGRAAVFSTAAIASRSAALQRFSASSSGSVTLPSRRSVVGRACRARPRRPRSRARRRGAGRRGRARGRNSASRRRSARVTPPRIAPASQAAESSTALLRSITA